MTKAAPAHGGWLVNVCRLSKQLMDWHRVVAFRPGGALLSDLAHLCLVLPLQHQARSTWEPLFRPLWHKAIQ